jgi:hypothetical protein
LRNRKTNAAHKSVVISIFLLFYNLRLLTGFYYDSLPFFISFSPPLVGFGAATQKGAQLNGLKRLSKQTVPGEQTSVQKECQALFNVLKNTNKKSLLQLKCMKIKHR